MANGKVFSFWLPTELVEALDERARDEETNRNKLVASILRADVEWCAKLAPKNLGDSK